jgi:hypothetical protein
MIKKELITKLPIDIIINIILPFLYQPQQQELLMDIKNFNVTFNEIDNYYAYEFNYFVMLQDLLNYFYYDNEYFHIILKRTFLFSDLEFITISKYIYENYHNKISKNRKPKYHSKIIWGLLIPNERKSFIDFINTLN